MARIESSSLMSQMMTGMSFSSSPVASEASASTFLSLASERPETAHVEVSSLSFLRALARCYKVIIPQMAKIGHIMKGIIFQKMSINFLYNLILFLKKKPVG